MLAAALTPLDTHASATAAAAAVPAAEQDQYVHSTVDCSSPATEPANLIENHANGHNVDVFVRDRLASCTRAAAPDASITASLSARSTTPARFGRVLMRFTVLRSGDVNVALERRRGFLWRRLAQTSLRVTRGPGQTRLGLLFPRLSPSPGVYHVVLRTGTTTLRLPLVVQ